MSFQRATIAAQAAGQINHATGGVVGPLETSTTFVRDGNYAPPPSGDIYRRDDNVTVREAETVIAALEGGAGATLFPSGLAAMAALMRAAPDGPIFLQRHAYYGSEGLATRLFGDAGRLILFDGDDMETLATMAAVERPSLILAETPSNPFLTVVPIATIAEIARGVGATLAIDSTAATPILTRPLSLGADIVLHSATKALNGHSDVLAGVLVTGETVSPLYERARAGRSIDGAVPSPFDAWQLTRGMRTVHLRVAAASQSALHVASVLEAHDGVEVVNYPGLPSHPQHSVAAAQMEGGFGGLLSFHVVGGSAAALAMVARLKLIHPATSLGGVESLIEHRASIEPESRGIPPGLLRLSVGIEAVGDLIDDLLGALDGLHHKAA
ncbi:MAG: PLP-dependent transferase [Pseudomonadota bacterium]